MTDGANGGRSNTCIEASIICVNCRDVQVGDHFAIHGNILSNLHTGKKFSMKVYCKNYIFYSAFASFISIFKQMKQWNKWCTKYKFTHIIIPTLFLLSYLKAQLLSVYRSELARRVPSSSQVISGVGLPAATHLRNTAGPGWRVLVWKV